MENPDFGSECVLITDVPLQIYKHMDWHKTAVISLKEKINKRDQSKQKF
jgi:hypothetical protein